MYLVLVCDIETALVQRYDCKAQKLGDVVGIGQSVSIPGGHKKGSHIISKI